MSKVEGLNKDQFRALRDVLSYRVEARTAYFSGGWRNPKRHLLGLRGDFPTGLLYLVENYLNGRTYQSRDLRKAPQLTFKGLRQASLGVTPYPEQEEAARAAVGHHRGVICAPTGVGKSLIVALLIKELGVKTLVVVPTLELKRQLTESLSKIFGSDNVGSLGSLVAVENVAALDPKVKLKDYDMVVIDEFHHSGAKTYRKLNQKAWTGVYYRIGLTATPFRSKDEERLLLESVLSEVIYDIDYQTAVKKGYIVPMEAYYYDLPLKEVEGNPTAWASVYSELIVSHEDRNKHIAELLEHLGRQGRSTLCLVKEIQHGRNIIEETAWKNFPFANGQDSEAQGFIKQFNQGRCKILLGTTGVLGEGVDTKPCEYVVIAGLGKSKNQFMQQVGRGFRTYPGKTSCKVIIFRDASHKWPLEHFKAQCKYLKEAYGVVPVRL